MSLTPFQLVGSNLQCFRNYRGLVTIHFVENVGKSRRYQLLLSVIEDFHETELNIFGYKKTSKENFSPSHTSI